MTVAVGAVTFAGWIVAFAKLQGLVSGAPLVFKGQHILNAALGIAIAALIVLLILGQSPELFWGLVIISLIPMLLISGIHFNHLWLIGGIFDKMPTWVTNGLGVSFYFGGTSLLIMVTVTLDTISQIQSHLIAQQYEGLVKRSRLGGRRR